MKKNLLAKVLSCVLAATMVLGLAACGDTKQEESKTPDSSKDNAEVSSEAEEEREAVEIVYYNWAHLDTSGTEAGKESMIKAVNEYLKEKLNTTVDFHLYNSVDYEANMGTIFSSGTYMDLVTSGTGTFNFAANATRNAYLALNDYIDEYLPGTKAQLPDSAWDAYTINGNIYAVPPIKDLPYNWGFVANQTLLDDLGVTVPEDYDTAWDLLPMLYEVKEKRDAKYPELKDQPIMNMTWFYLEAWEYFEGFVGGLNSTLAGANIPGLDGFEGYGDGETVFCPYMTDEFRKIAHEERKLVAEGLAPVDRKGFDQDKVIYQKGQLIGGLGLGYIEYDEDTTMPYYKSKLYPAKNCYLSTNTAGVCGTSVPAISENPERALEVLELFNNDEYLATTLRFGAEGEGWTDADNDGIIELTEANADSSRRLWYHWYGFQLASLQTTKAIPGSSSQFGELLNELNNTATAADNMGFLADVSNIQNEIAACSAVKDEFRSVLLEGQVEDVDGTVDAFVQKLKDNGIQTIIDEVQSQLDAWRAENK